MTKNPVRIQISCYNILTAEVIVQDYAEANKLWAHYSVAKWRRGLPIGGAIIQLSTLPRVWNVKVGERIN